MKRIVFLSLLFLLLATLVSPVLAENGSTENRMFEKTRDGSKAATRMEKIQTGKDKIAEKRSDNLQERANREINRRIESLKKLLTRIKEFKKISVSQKASLSAQVQAEIDKLTVLQAKIEADTDQTTLKTDVQSIVGSYRIYALFIPKIQILGSADRILTTADVMSSQAARLETKITEQQTNGQNVTDAQALLSDMKAKIADAKTQAQNAINTVTPLTPDGYPGNKTQLQSARQMVVTALKDLNMARQDARKIIVWLIQLGDGKKTTPTP